jgi:hypothetical protein
MLTKILAIGGYGSKRMRTVLKYWPLEAMVSKECLLKYWLLEYGFKRMLSKILANGDNRFKSMFTIYRYYNIMRYVFLSNRQVSMLQHHCSFTILALKAMYCTGTGTFRVMILLITMCNMRAMILLITMCNIRAMILLITMCNIRAMILLITMCNIKNTLTRCYCTLRYILKYFILVRKLFYKCCKNQWWAKR